MASTRNTASPAANAAQARQRASLALRLGVSLGDAGGDELGFELGELAGVRLRPLLGGDETGASVEPARIAVGLHPVVCGGRQMAEQAEPFGLVVDPVHQSGPLPDQGLVADLHRRLPTGWVAVERQQPSTAEFGDDVVRERRQLAAARSPARRFSGLAGSDEAGEQPACCSLVLRRQPAEHLLGSLGERTVHSAEALVVVEGHRPLVGCGFEYLGQHVLHHRQRAGRSGSVADHLGDQRGLDGDSGVFGGADDGLVQLIGRERGDQHRPIAEEPTGDGVVEHTAEEVGATGGDHADRCAGVVDGLDQRGRGNGRVRRAPRW